MSKAKTVDAEKVKAIKEKIMNISRIHHKEKVKQSGLHVSHVSTLESIAYAVALVIEENNVNNNKNKKRKE